MKLGAFGSPSLQVRQGHDYISCTILTDIANFRWNASLIKIMNTGLHKFVKFPCEDVRLM
jgi:hypothetical protein